MQSRTFTIDCAPPQLVREVTVQFGNVSHCPVEHPGPVGGAVLPGGGGTYACTPDSVGKLMFTRLGLMVKRMR